MRPGRGTSTATASCCLERVVGLDHTLQIADQRHSVHGMMTDTFVRFHQHRRTADIDGQPSLSGPSAQGPDPRA